MASPVAAVFGGQGFTTTTDPWSVSLFSPSAGDLLVLFPRTAAASTLTAFTGFTQLTKQNGDASDDDNYIFYRLCDGTEGTTGSIDWTAALKGASSTFLITGAADPATQAPEFTVAVGTTANADPPAITPTGGSKDYLFLLFLGMDSETATATPDAAYTGDDAQNSGTGGAVATNCMIWTASRQATTTSENPAAWTSSAPANGWTAFTVAIHPPGAAIPPSVLPERMNVVYLSG